MVLFSSIMLLCMLSLFVWNPFPLLYNLELNVYKILMRERCCFWILGIPESNNAVELCVFPWYIPLFV